MLDTQSLLVVAPEIVLAVMACAILLVDLGVKSRLRDLTYVLTLATLAVVTWLCASAALDGTTRYAFGKMIVSEPILDSVFDAPGQAWLTWLTYAVAVVGVLGLGVWSTRRNQPEPTAN